MSVHALSLRIGSADLETEDEDEDEEATHFDFVIAVPKVSEKYMAELKKAVENAGFVTDLFESWALKDEQAVLFCRIGLPINRCREYADAVNAPGRLDPQKLRQACARLDPPIDFKHKAVGGRSFAEVTKMHSLYPPFLHLFTPFRQEKTELFMPWIAHNYHKLQLRLMASPTELPDTDEGKPCPAKGAGFNIRLMDQVHPRMEFEVEDKTNEGPRMATLFLLHDPLEDKLSLRYRLYWSWIKGPWSALLLPWTVPVDELREYLGDQAGFYFLFLSTFTTYVIPVGIIGAIIMVAVYSAPVSEKLERQLPACIFSPFLMIFMTIFMVRFRRRQATSAKEWGCYAWTSGNRPVRPDFNGEPQTDPIDGHIIMDFAPALRRRRQAVTWTAIALLLGIALLAVNQCIVLKVWSASQPEGSFWQMYGGYIGTAIDIVQVQGGNIIFTKIARRLTLYENWKTDPDYCESLTGKLFLFKFINTFAAVYYAAFGKEVFEDNGCDNPGGCLEELRVTIMPIFVSGAVISLVTQIFIPWLKKRRIQKWSGGDYGDDDDGRAAVRRQFNELTEYDNIEGPIEDNMEIVLQFCYMSCFGAAFPLSPFICAAANLIQLRQDGYKLLWLHRRLISMEVSDVGIWDDIYKAILHLAMPTNMGILVFTSKVTDDRITLAHRWVVFFMGCLFYQQFFNILQMIFPAMSKAVQVQLERQEDYGNRVVQDIFGDEVFDEAEAEEDKGNIQLLDATHVKYMFKRKSQTPTYTKALSRVLVDGWTSAKQPKVPQPSPSGEPTKLATYMSHSHLHTEGKVGKEDKGVNMEEVTGLS